jgi:hypothetical protein
VSSHKNYLIDCKKRRITKVDNSTAIITKEKRNILLKIKTKSFRFSVSNINTEMNYEHNSILKNNGVDLISTIQELTKINELDSHNYYIKNLHSIQNSSDFLDKINIKVKSSIKEFLLYFSIFIIVSISLYLIFKLILLIIKKRIEFKFFELEITIMNSIN